MNHRITSAALIGVWLVAAPGCAFEDYTTFYAYVDAGPGAAGAGGARPSSVEVDASRTTEPAVADAAPEVVQQDDAAALGGCTACVRLAGGAGVADYQLQLGTTWNLSATNITWRLRVRNFAGEVSIVPYVQSGEGFQDEARLATPAQLGAGDWQEVAFDLSVPDGGAGPGAGAVEFGATFDATRVRRIGIALQVPEMSAPARALIEIDSVTFSDVPALDVDFGTGQGGFRLVDSSGVSVTHVPG